MGAETKVFNAPNSTEDFGSSYAASRTPIKIEDVPASSVELLDDMEEVFAPVQGPSKSAASELTQDIGRDASTKLDLSGGAALAASPTSRAAGSCTTPWFLSYHRWKDQGIPGVWMKSRMWVDSSAFWGSATNPDACGRPINRQSKIHHKGSAWWRNFGNFPSSAAMVRIDFTAYNSSYAQSYRSENSAGSAAKRIVCGKSTHEYTSYSGYVNSWNKYSGSGCGG